MRFLHWLTVPLNSGEIGLPLWSLYVATVVIITVFVVSLTLILTFGGESLFEEKSLKLVLIKGSFHLICTLFYIPLTSFILSLSFCSPQNDDVALDFRTLYNESNCWGIQSIFIRSSLLLLLVFLFCCVLSYHLCCYDGNPCSKRPFARAYSHVQFWLFLSKSVLLLIYYFLPFRPWLFRTVYLFCSLFIPFLVITRLPFYKSTSNLRYVIFLSLWTATAFCYLINLIYISNHVTQSKQGSVVLLTWTFLVVLFSFIHYLACKNSINRYYRRPLNNDVSSLAPNSLPSSNLYQNPFIGVLPDMDESDTYGTENELETETHEPLDTITNQPIKLPPINFVWQVELFTRFLQPKPHRVENHLAVVSIKSLINALDCDLNLRHRFLLHYYQFYADNLRRRTNTGTEAANAQSSYILQKSLREARELHKDCLDCLIQFWKTLTVENARIAKLPLITDKLRSLKTSADNIFKLLLNSFPDSREVLSVYAKYIREINMDGETAKRIEDSVDMQSSSEGTSSRAPSQALSTDYTPSMSKGVRKKRKKRRMLLEVGTDDQSHHHVERLSRIMLVSFTLVGVVTILSFIYFTNTLSDVSNRAQQLIESSHILAVANKILPETQLLGYYFDDGEQYKTQILEDAEHIGYHARRVFMGSDSLTNTSSYICPRVNDAPLSEIHDELVSEFLMKPTFLSFSYSGTNPPVSHAKILNYWEIVLSYSMAAVDFVTSFDGRNLFGNNHYRFLLHNGRAMNRGGQEFWTKTLEASLEFFNLSRLISSISLLLCFAA
ncbi:hypothetical protein GEMRC1_013533 [Eukaryota sp. GEM-RC1]